MTVPEPGGPCWGSLYETAAAQSGYFTTAQAAEAGYSTQLLRKHILAGRIARPHRGLYRLVHFPTGDHEELAIAWLWSDRIGIVSHATALLCHGLSDVLPAKIDLTVPSRWRDRRLRVPLGVELHYADIPVEERTWFHDVPITTPRRTLNDSACDGLSPELLRHATQQALKRGIATKAQLGEVEAALAAFGGIE